MKAGPLPPSDDRAARGVPFPWGTIMGLLAVMAFLYALRTVRSPVILVNAALATVIALIYAAQRGEGLARRAVGWCILFGVWASALFGFMLPWLFTPVLPIGAGLGPTALGSAIIILAVYGGILLLLIWPYARRVVGLTERPLWAEERPALELAIVTILVLFTVGAIISLVRMGAG